MSIRLLLAEDHAMFRELLARQLEEEPHMRVVAQVDNGRDAIESARELSPDVALMDIDMPGLNGVEATGQILQENPRIKVIGVSVHSDRSTIMRMFSAGAVGYLPKKCALEELIQAIKTVAANKVYVSPSVARVVVEHFVSHHPVKEAMQIKALSRREREVLQSIAEGRSTKEIAFDLKVSVKTVESHRKNIMDKLQLYSVAELTKFAVREGLTSLD